jgi:hypothetical protein
MGNVTTSSESTAPSNPNVQPAVSKLLQGLQSQYDAGVPVYQKSLYPGVSDTTNSAWAQGTGVASSLIGSGGFNGTQTGAMSTLRGLDAGYGGLSDAYSQDAPGYSTLRSNLMDDAVKNVGSAFTSSGRFGGGSYVDTATKSAVDAVAPLDYTNFQNDINNRYRSLDSRAGLGQTIFGMGQQGIANQNAAVSALGAIGSARDADMLAARQGENDLFRRNADAGWERLARSSAILGGTAPYGGQESSQSVPWWAALGGGLATTAGALF